MESRVERPIHAVSEEVRRYSVALKIKSIDDQIVDCTEHVVWCLSSQYLLSLAERRMAGGSDNSRHSSVDIMWLPALSFSILLCWQTAIRPGKPLVLCDLVEDWFLISLKITNLSYGHGHAHHLSWKAEA